MIKEIQKAVGQAIKKDGVKLHGTDVTEPINRPGYKIFIENSCDRINDSVVINTYTITVVYWASDLYDYYTEIVEMKEWLQDVLMTGFYTENVLWVQADKIKIEEESCTIALIFDVVFDDYNTNIFDNVNNDELMEELNIVYGKEQEVED